MFITLKNVEDDWMEFVDADLSDEIELASIDSQISEDEVPEEIRAIQAKFDELNMSEDELDPEEVAEMDNHWIANEDRSIFGYYSKDIEAPFNPSGYVFFYKQNTFYEWGMYGTIEILAR